MEQVISRQVNGVDQMQCSLWAIDFRYGDGAIERNNRAGRNLHQLIVKRKYLSPIGVCSRWRVAVHRIDGRLKLIRAGPISRQTEPQ